jgi:hypothetical protein
MVVLRSHLEIPGHYNLNHSHQFCLDRLFLYIPKFISFGQVHNSEDLGLSRRCSQLRLCLTAGSKSTLPLTFLNHNHTTPG